MRRYFCKLGWRCIDIDILNSPTDDLLNDEVWELVFEAVTQDLVAFVWMGPPCTTFSPARRHKPGPRPLRDASHPRGFPKEWLTPAEVEELRAGNYFALQCCRLATSARAVGVGFAIENPAPWWDSSCASMFDLEELWSLGKLAGVQTVEFHQCMFGALTAKPTRVLYWGAELACLGTKCTHPPSWMWCEYFNASGHPVKQRLWRAHPQLVKSRDAKGCWLSKAAAAYPAALNQAIAVAVAGTGVCQKQ